MEIERVGSGSAGAFVKVLHFLRWAEKHVCKIKSIHQIILLSKKPMSSHFHVFLNNRIFIRFSYVIPCMRSSSTKLSLRSFHVQNGGRITVAKLLTHQSSHFSSHWRRKKFPKRFSLLIKGSMLWKLK
jgi:hypothetical protein